MLDPQRTTSLGGMDSEALCVDDHPQSSSALNAKEDQQQATTARRPTDLNEDCIPIQSPLALQEDGFNFADMAHASWYLRVLNELRRGAEGEEMKASYVVPAWSSAGRNLLSKCSLRGREKRSSNISSADDTASDVRPRVRRRTDDEIHLPVSAPPDMAVPTAPKADDERAFLLKYYCFESTTRCMGTRVHMALDGFPSIAIFCSTEEEMWRSTAPSQRHHANTAMPHLFTIVEPLPSLSGSLLQNVRDEHARERKKRQAQRQDLTGRLGVGYERYALLQSLNTVYAHIFHNESVLPHASIFRSNRSDTYLSLVLDKCARLLETTWSSHHQLRAVLHLHSVATRYVALEREVGKGIPSAREVLAAMTATISLVDKLVDEQLEGKSVSDSEREEHYINDILDYFARSFLLPPEGKAKAIENGMWEVARRHLVEADPFESLFKTSSQTPDEVQAHAQDTARDATDPTKLCFNSTGDAGLDALLNVAFERSALDEMTTEYNNEEKEDELDIGPTDDYDEDDFAFQEHSVCYYTFEQGYRLTTHFRSEEAELTPQTAYRSGQKIWVHFTSDEDRAAGQATWYLSSSSYVVR